jgi:hypothetical protein
MKVCFHASKDTSKDKRNIRIVYPAKISIVLRKLAQLSQYVTIINNQIRKETSSISK